MTRTIMEWSKIIEGKTPEEIAQFLCGDLEGYPITPISHKRQQGYNCRRENDEATIANLILALYARVP